MRGVRARRGATGSSGRRTAPSDGSLGANERATLLGVFVVVFAVGMGASAGLLQGFQVLPAPAANHAPLNVGVFGWLVVALGLSLVVIAFIVLLFRGSKGQGGIPPGAAISLLTLVLTFVIVIGILALASHDQGQTLLTGGNTTIGGSTNSSHPGGGGGGGGGGNLSGKTNGTFGKPSSVPPISVLVESLGVGVVLAIVLVPLSTFLVLRWRRRGREVYLGPSPELISKLESALDALKRSSTTEARGRIIEAYALLLSSLEARRLPNLEQSTPREIEGEMAQTLRLSTPGARALRELFEEARYSTHVMTVEQEQRAVESLASILEELRSKDAQRERERYSEPEEVMA
jgi:hypothetical protein